MHPTLSRLALHVALAQGRDALHAGALLGSAGAWAVVGTKEAGKSTLLAACARAGIEVMTDDALFIDGDSCLAGPRCIDLRPAPDRLIAGTTPVRPATPRHRLTLARGGRGSRPRVPVPGWGHGPAPPGPGGPTGPPPAPPAPPPRLPTLGPDGPGGPAGAPALPPPEGGGRA